MKTFFDPSARAALLARFDRLTPESRPAWGKMNVGQMVCHLSDSLRAAVGDLPCAPKKSFLSNPVMRWLVIHHLPWPKGAPSSPELLSTPPAAELETDKREFHRLAEAFAARGAQGITAVHPAFGDISGKTWGALVHRHVDHHLRQFRV